MTEAELAQVTGECVARFPELEVVATSDPMVLARIVEAEVEAVERYAGVRQTSETFVHTAGRLPRLISLIRPAEAITSIAERRSLVGAAVTLDATDWRQLDEWRVLRLPEGTHRAPSWGEEVVVGYDAIVDEGLRSKVVAELVQLTVAFSAHERVSSTIGDYAETFSDADPGARRAAILAQLTVGAALIL